MDLLKLRHFCSSIGRCAGFVNAGVKLRLKPALVGAKS